ncbi:MULTISPECIES: hypothetical protein [Oxalobacteraceae]|jgi:hypothetical protein|uniref:hypothetical protein n=1 Tax=Oxalobacteraceae TaxID=75682 RepID=UPI0010A39DE7|nr:MULTISPECIES: hypothetical protein [Oxalobacteraceae]
MLKFNFSVKNRMGQRVGNIIIGGRDRADAERKLFQMYRHCTILECAFKRPEEKTWHAVELEDALSTTPE